MIVLDNDIVIFFDGENIAIRMPDGVPKTKNIRGLCGTYDGDRTNDMMTIQGNYKGIKKSVFTGSYKVASAAGDVCLEKLSFKSLMYSPDGKLFHLVFPSIKVTLFYIFFEFRWTCESIPLLLS